MTVEKMIQTAKKLDIFFKIFSVICTIAMILALVLICLTGALAFDKLPPEQQIGMDYNVLDLGMLQLTLSESVVPDKGNILAITAADLVMAFVFLLLTKILIHCIRDILHPMTEGLPFHGSIAKNTKKLAVLYLVTGLFYNCMDFLNGLLTVNCYDLQNLFISDSITHLSIMYDFDLDFLVVGAILLLLSYIFSYGEQLQQLSDETL